MRSSSFTRRPRLCHAQAVAVALALFVRRAEAQPSSPASDGGASTRREQPSQGEVQPSGQAPARSAAEPAAVSGTPGSPNSPAGYGEPLAQPAALSAHTLVDDSPRAHDGHPLAGYHNGLFFLRDHHDNFHLYIQGRAQLDFYSYFGPGVSDTALHPTLFIRRIRPEVTGEFLGRWRFMIAGDFGATALDNPNGTTEVMAAAPGSQPNATSARFAAADATRFQAGATDVFINYRESSAFNVMVGQMDAPFTMENRTSDKFIPFMERSLAIRAVGIPTNKELGGMVWGETTNRLFYYSIGPYMGDGQNRPNVDSRMDLFARTFVHPFATSSLARDNPLRDAHIGASVHYGSRDKKWVNYDYPALTTQGAFVFWSPVYRGANGNTHVLPVRDQLSVAGELRVPIGRFDVTSEVVYISNDTREALEGFQATNAERSGRMQGVAYYATLGYWLGRRDVNGVPGYGNPPRLDWSKTDPVVPDEALQMLVKWEQVALHYRSSSRAGLPDPRNVDGEITMNALSAGVNYWATRHVRLSLNYVYNMVPDSAPPSATSAGGVEQTSRQRAVAPGNTLPKGIDDRSRDEAHSLHEVLARFAIAL